MEQKAPGSDGERAKERQQINGAETNLGGARESKTHQGWIENKGGAQSRRN